MKKKTVKKRVAISWRALTIVNTDFEITEDGWHIPFSDEVKTGKPISGKTMKAIHHPAVLAEINRLDPHMIFRGCPKNVRSRHKYTLIAENWGGQNSIYDVRVNRE
ncbi:hypothetical protein CGS57_02240 [Faecalibacterium prausnitzii]|jgi:hypothetical protein|nr:hypothetical protein CGS53_02205 [Faecalibacterium prausnitzii]PDX79227.1 hypothetical protein CGS57_02240 [Faecalibacterium prausnitzii]